jgi:SAM-dependent methyltransferase
MSGSGQRARPLPVQHPDMTDDYVLGTDDDELARLGRQHAVWRDDAHAAWQRADIAAGQTVVDVGCGPGFAAADLAGVVGEHGRVIALDKSERYLAALRTRGLAQIEPRVCDLDRDDLPVAGADAAWARWVFCFVARPRELLARVTRALRPGGVFVAHEYFDYAAWRASPRTPELEEFVAAVQASWRRQGGEPDIALDLVAWLGELGFDVATRAIVDVVARDHAKWRWMADFGATGPARLVELGEVSRDRADAMEQAWRRLAANPSARLVTPAVLEIVARRRVDVAART